MAENRHFLPFFSDFPVPGMIPAGPCRMMRLAQGAQIGRIQTPFRRFPHTFDMIDVQPVSRRPAAGNTTGRMQGQMTRPDLFPGRIVSTLAG